MKSFAEPQLLVDHIVIIGPTEDGGTIQAICSGNEEPEVCSRLGIDTQSIVRLEVSEQNFIRSAIYATVHMLSVKPALTETVERNPHRKGSYCARDSSTYMCMHHRYCYGIA